MEASKFNGVLSTKNFDISARKRDLSHSGVNSTYQPTTFYQSTPKGKTSLTSPVSLVNGSIARSQSSGQRSPSSAGRRSASPLHARSASPSKLHHGSISPRQLLDVDTDTIQKQRRELQLLIGELKDRDRELNDMVHTHQKHLQSWDEDRQRILALERRCARLEGELKSRNEQCKVLTARLKSTEAEELSKRKELEATMDRLKEATEQAEFATQQLQDLEDKNTNLEDSLRELSNNLGQLQAREQELLTKIKLKENDITEANIRIGEFQQKTRRLENALQEYQTVEKALRAERDQFRDLLNATKNEVDNLRGEMSKQFSDADDLQSELAQSKQDVLVLQKEIFLAGEREKRKDQLLELQKSKQERTDAELQNLRQICERQQRDISYMQMQLQSSQESFLKAETKDERFYDDTPVVSSHPDWLNTASDSMGYHGQATFSGLGDNPLHGNAFPSKSAQTSSPVKDIARDFTNLSMSPEVTSESEQFFPLPTFSGAHTFPASNFLDQTAVMVGSPGDTTQQHDNEVSPTSKLHRLLAESRQMVQTLEHSTISTPPAASVDGSEKFTPPSATSPNVD